MIEIRKSPAAPRSPFLKNELLSSSQAKLEAKIADRLETMHSAMINKICFGKNKILSTFSEYPC